MSFRSIEQGIAAIQAGQRDEGMRMLRIALRSPEVAGPLRAVACIWLAESLTDPAERRAFYDEAVLADPNNPQVRQRYEAFLATQLLPPQPPQPTVSASSAPPSLPGMPPSVPGMNSSAPAAPGSPFAPARPSATRPVAPAPPAAPPNLYHVVTIIGGPNGPGTGFYVAREGLIATTRYVVGGMPQVTVELQNGKQIPGYVVRSFPEYDLTFVYIEQQINDLMPVTPLAAIADDTRLNIITYKGDIVRGRRRSTKRVIAPHWFPTDVSSLPDAGGGPTLDEQHYLVGMITRNTASTSGYVYGLHINLIRTMVEHFRQESGEGQRAYCHHCGHFSRALFAGGYYCEKCGGLNINAENMLRFPQPQMQTFYYEYSRVSCPHCNANVGFHKNACLRCGRSV